MGKARMRERTDGCVGEKTRGRGRAHTCAHGPSLISFSLTLSVYVLSRRVPLWFSESSASVGFGCPCRNAGSST